MMKGFHDLQTPSDLLDKLERDVDRLDKEPLNSDIAFDVLVTASSLPDWYCHKYGGDPEKLRQEDHHLVVCNDIAIGAKHFEKTRGNKKSVVSGTENKAGWGGHFEDPTWYSADWGFQPDVIINLDGDAKEKLGTSITARKLGKNVITYWKKKLSED